MLFSSSHVTFFTFVVLYGIALSIASTHRARARLFFFFHLMRRVFLIYCFTVLYCTARFSHDVTPRSFFYHPVCVPRFSCFPALTRIIPFLIGWSIVGCRHTPSGEQRAGQAERAGAVVLVPRLVRCRGQPAGIKGRASASGDKKKIYIYMIPDEFKARVRHSTRLRHHGEGRASASGGEQTNKQTSKK